MFLKDLENPLDIILSNFRVTHFTKLHIIKPLLTVNIKAKGLSQTTY